MGITAVSVGVHQHAPCFGNMVSHFLSSSPKKTAKRRQGERGRKEVEKKRKKEWKEERKKERKGGRKEGGREEGRKEGERKGGRGVRTNDKHKENQLWLDVDVGSVNKRKQTERQTKTDRVERARKRWRDGSLDGCVVSKDGGGRLWPGLLVCLLQVC